MKKQINFTNGFSVAEAMIALLIGSLALGMAAPMITKQIKQNNFADTQFSIISSQNNHIRESVDELKEEIKKEANNAVPDGAVMFFYLSECPNGWEPLTSHIADTSDVFIRNVGSLAGGVGRVQAPALPNITGVGARFSHEVFNGNGLSGAIFSAGNSTGGGGENGDGGWGGSRGWNFDASRSSSIYQTGVSEVRPKSIALLACIRVKN